MLEWLNSRPWGKQLLSNPQIQVVITASLSMGWDLIYGLFCLTHAVIHASAWYLTLFAYYIVLGGMRLSIVSLSWKSSRRELKKVLRHNGYAMMALAVIISGVTVLSILNMHVVHHGLIAILTIATFTFLFVTLAVIHLVRAWRNQSSEVFALRNISCCSAIGSLLSLERIMLVAFGNGNTEMIHKFLAASGAGAFMLIMFLGVSLVRSERLN